MAVCTMFGAPLPEAWIGPLVALDDLAGDQRMTIEAARQRRHAHAVIDAELQRLHAVAHGRVRSSSNSIRIRIVGEAAQSRASA